MAKSIDYTKYVLPNGLKVILYPRSEIHSVHISVDVNVGSLDETSETTGLSHLIEHLPFDGTEDFKSWEAVDEYNNKISGSSNAYTSSTHTRYYGYYPYQYLDEAFCYLAQLVLHPLHRIEDIKKEKDIVFDEMKSQKDTTAYKIYTNILNNRYVDSTTPYSFDIIGTENTLISFNKKMIKDYYDKYYVPENMEIFVVGNFEIENIKKIIEKYFHTEIKSRRFPKKPKRDFEVSYPEYSGFKVNAVQKQDLDQYYLTFTFPKLEFKKYSQKERLLVPFLSSLTASSQYQQSILWRRLREELGIVYDVSAYGYDYFNRAFLTIQTSFSPQHLETVLTEVYNGIKKIKDGNVNDSVFKSRQKRIIDTELMTYDYPSNVLNWIMDQEYENEYHGTFLTPEDFVKIIKEIKFEDIIKTANKIYDLSKLNIGIVSGDKAKWLEPKVRKIWNSLAK